MKREEFTNTRASKHNEPPQAVVVEIRTPGEKDFAAENKNCGGIPEEAKTAWTTRGSSTKEKQNARKANKSSVSGFFATQIKENEFTENGDNVLTVKTIRKFNKEVKRERLPDSEIEARSPQLLHRLQSNSGLAQRGRKENLGALSKNAATEQNTSRRRNNR